MTTATPCLADIAASWYDRFAEAGGPAGKGPDWMIAEGELKAHQYLELGTAYADYQPGNGTRYLIVLHDLAYEQAKTLGGDREAAKKLGMAGRAGGELLVSMPESCGGRSSVFSVHDGALFVPEYVEERLALRWADALPVAVYLSAFAQKVAALRA